MTKVHALVAGKTEFRAAAAGPASGEIILYDRIGEGGVTAGMFRDALQKVASARQITLRINSPGGDAFAAIAMHNMLARAPQRKVVTVDGLAASGASLVAMAGDSVQMPSNALMMIHLPWAATLGDARDMRDMAVVLDKLRDQMINTYAAKTGLDSQKIADLLAAETWLTANEALALHFADEVVAPAKIAARFDISHFATQPNAASGWDAAFDYVDALRPRPVWGDAECIVAPLSFLI